MTRNATKHLEFKFALQYKAEQEQVTVAIQLQIKTNFYSRKMFLRDYAKGVIIFSIKADEKWLEVHVVKNSVSVSRHLKEIQVDWLESWNVIMEWSVWSRYYVRTCFLHSPLSRGRAAVTGVVAPLVVAALPPEQPHPLLLDVLLRRVPHHAVERRLEHPAQPHALRHLPSSD